MERNAASEMAFSAACMNLERAIAARLSFSVRWGAPGQPAHEQTVRLESHARRIAAKLRASGESVRVYMQYAGKVSITNI